MRSPILRALLLGACIPLLAAACGDDEDQTASGSASASASASGSASGSASAVAEADCSPVGEELEGDATEVVEVGLDEYAFSPSELEVGAGTVTFAASNDGDEPHELAFLPGGGDVPLTEDGTPDEAALEEAGAFELEAFGPGQVCNATYELEAGSYTVFCIVEAEDGQTHYEKGMAGTLEVS